MASSILEVSQVGGIPMVEIVPGAQVQVRTADNRHVLYRATSGVERRRDSLVVWVCGEKEWEAAQAEGRKPRGIPWPAEEVQEVDA